MIAREDIKGKLQSYDMGYGVPTPFSLRLCIYIYTPIPSIETEGPGNDSKIYFS